jgi:hypothetical protein
MSDDISEIQDEAAEQRHHPEQLAGKLGRLRSEHGQGLVPGQSGRRPGRRRAGEPLEQRLVLGL